MTRERGDFRKAAAHRPRQRGKHVAGYDPYLDRMPVAGTPSQSIYPVDPIRLIYWPLMGNSGRMTEEGVGKRRSLEQHLRPIANLELPGKEHLERYVLYKYRLNLKAGTIRGTVECGKLFLAFLKRTGKELLEEVSREDLEAFVEDQQDRGLKPQTVHTRLTNIRAFLNYLRKEGVVDPEVLYRRMRIKLPEALPKAIDPEDVELILSVLDNARDRAMILVLLRTGMRIGELLNTRVVDVNLPEQRINIPEGEKNAIGRVVYLSDDACDALQAWITKRDKDKVLLFYGQGKTSLGYAAARSVFMKYVHKAGLDHKGYTLHQLRHTFASEMLNAGMYLECVQELLGHCNIEITRRYARLTDKTREKQYFRAMEIIERGEIDGHYQLDSELQEILEEKKLLRQHRKELSERPETISDMDQRTD